MAVHTGKVDMIRDGIAYVSISFNGEPYWAEIDEDKLAKYGIGDHDRFEMTLTAEEITFKLIPRRWLTKAEMDRIDAELNEALPDGLLSQEEF